LTACSGARAERNPILAAHVADGALRTTAQTSPVCALERYWGAVRWCRLTRADELTSAQR
jgi:hypothetical protein